MVKHKLLLGKTIKGLGHKFRTLNTVKLESPRGRKGLAIKLRGQENHFTVRSDKSRVATLSLDNLAF